MTHPPNLWWSAELANEAAGEPLDGLIEGNTYGLFCFQLREWARLASLPADAVRLVPDTGQAPGGTGDDTARAQETEARNALAEKFLDHLLDHERSIAPAIAGGLAIRLANVVLSAGWQPSGDTEQAPQEGPHA